MAVFRKACHPALFRRFLNFKDLIATNVLETLANSTWPVNLDALHRRLLTKPEMNAPITGGEVTACRGYRLHLDTICGCNFDFCPNRVSSAFVSYEFQGQPMVRC